MVTEPLSLQNCFVNIFDHKTYVILRTDSKHNNILNLFMNWRNKNARFGRILRLQPCKDWHN